MYYKDPTKLAYNKKFLERKSNIKNHNTPILETERLILRKFTENDIAALFAIYKDEEVNIYLPWFPLKSLEEAEKFFKDKYIEAYKQSRGYKYAICLKADNIPIGYVNVSYNYRPSPACGDRQLRFRRIVTFENVHNLYRKLEVRVNRGLFRFGYCY